jgi:hypothetical protein
VIHTLAVTTDTVGGIVEGMSRREETESRVEAQLGRMNWPHAGEVARQINLSTGTARQYLYQLVAQGRAERREAPDVRNPATGGFGYRFSRLDPPLPPASPTSDLLCPSCIQRGYRDLLRYLEVLDDRDLEADAPDDPDVHMDYLDNARCDRCGELRFPSADPGDVPSVMTSRRPIFSHTSARDRAA